MKKLIVLFAASAGLAFGQQMAPVDPCCWDQCCWDQFPDPCLCGCIALPLEIPMCDPDGICVNWEPPVCSCDPWLPVYPEWLPCTVPAPVPE